MLVFVGGQGRQKGKVVERMIFCKWLSFPLIMLFLFGYLVVWNSVQTLGLCPSFYKGAHVFGGRHETWRMECIEQQLKWTKCTVPHQLQDTLMIYIRSNGEGIQRFFLVPRCIDIQFVYIYL